MSVVLSTSFDHLFADNVLQYQLRVLEFNLYQ